MAITTKTPKRSTAASTKKKGFLGRSFNLKSRKVQFIVSILIIAVIGGGYFTFKSFAGTAVATWGPGSSGVSMQNTSCKVQIIGDTGTVAGSKGSVAVWNVACPANTATVINSPRMSRLEPGIYQVCTMVKGSGQISIIQEGTGYAPVANITVVNDGAYHEYCNQGSGSTSQYYDHTAAVRVNPNSWLSISSIKLSKLTLGTPVNSSSK